MNYFELVAWVTAAFIASGLLQFVLARIAIWRGWYRAALVFHDGILVLVFLFIAIVLVLLLIAGGSALMGKFG